MVLDVLLAARDRGLYSAVTDCALGGFSSPRRRDGRKIGEVWLDQAPLKYELPRTRKSDLRSPGTDGSFVPEAKWTN